MLPWRKTRDPYKIWLSEVILQQTRITQGLPYYNELVTRFPTIHHLARAPLRDVLRQWQGLGYYSRARNLHRCAKEVVMNHGGVFPRTYDELLTLPGIGTYTAAAMASICFGESRAVLDGNVFRVLARYFALAEDIHSAAGRKVFSRLANRLISPKEPGEFNQAVMEFGALYCVPRNPDCGNCALSGGCQSNRRGTQHTLPVKRSKGAVTSRYLYYLVADDGKRVLLRQRKPGDIWTGLFEFPLVETRRNISTTSAVSQLMGNKMPGVKPRATSISHLLSHQRLQVRFIYIPCKDIEMQSLRRRWPECGAYTLAQADRLPKPVPVTRFLDGVRQRRKE
jgi:A/G-specific adenine glycosylase